jgi:hypothetical protein
VWRLALLLLPVTVFAQTYSDKTKEAYQKACLSQPIRPHPLITPEKRQNYCLCLYNFTQKALPYPDYQRVDALARRQKMQQIAVEYPIFVGQFEQASLLCARRFVMMQ